MSKQTKPSDTLLFGACRVSSDVKYREKKKNYIIHVSKTVKYHSRNCEMRFQLHAYKYKNKKTINLYFVFIISQWNN